MKISKLCKYAVIPAAILILSQTGIGKAIADTLTPAAVSSTASVGQTAQKGTTASTAKMATKAQGDSVSGDGWTIIPGKPGFLVNLGFPASLAFLANLGFLAFQETVRGQRRRLRRPLPLLPQLPQPHRLHQLHQPVPMWL